MRMPTRAAAALWLLSALNASAATLDVPTPYIPSTRGNVDEMLRLAGVTPNDVVYDLGSGDGRIVIAAARDYGARGVGIDDISYRFEGIVRDDVIEGVVRYGYGPKSNEQRWRAQRAAATP